MTEDRFDKMLAFLHRLEEAKIHFTLNRNRYDAISVEIVAPGERWEVDFLDDGSVDVERFRSNGEIYDESVLEELFALCSDDQGPVTQDDATART
jgi:hypothetical protein